MKKTPSDKFKSFMSDYKDFSKENKNLFEVVGFESNIIPEYADLFFERFNHIYKKNNQKLVSKVMHTEQLIIFFFKLVPFKSKDARITLTKEKTITVFDLLLSLGVSDISERLLINNNTKGFLEDSFWVAKPNQQRFWSKGVCYFDLEEFFHAILTAGIDLRMSEETK